LFQGLIPRKITMVPTPGTLAEVGLSASRSARLAEVPKLDVFGRESASVTCKVHFESPAYRQGARTRPPAIRTDLTT
jgi:hypothetical protein